MERIEQRFREFADASRRLLASNAQQQRSLPRTTEFRAFISRAERYTIDLAMTALNEAMPHLRALVPWLVSEDILAVAGLRFDENAYTELLAWALHPQTHPPSGLHRQRAWLAAAGVPRLQHSSIAPVSPTTQVATLDGIPDLILDFPQMRVVVEAKTTTTEHRTPSGHYQTVSYAQVLRTVPERPVHVVFLTLDGAAGVNPSASRVTYAATALALARALQGFDLPTPLRQSFAAVISHFAFAAVPFSESLLRFVSHLDPETHSFGEAPPINLIKSRLLDVQSWHRLFATGEEEHE